MFAIDMVSETLACRPSHCNGGLTHWYSGVLHWNRFYSIICGQCLAVVQIAAERYAILKYKILYHVCQVHCIGMDYKLNSFTLFNLPRFLDLPLPSLRQEVCWYHRTCVWCNKSYVSTTSGVTAPATKQLTAKSEITVSTLELT